MSVEIRPARPGEGDRLREIATASKLHWGYDREKVVEWVATGEFSDENLARLDVYVAEADGRAIAWGAVERKSEDFAWLTDLWVEPEWIGKGVGRSLFQQCVERARELGARRLGWESDPYAVGFYERQGARRTGRETVSSWSRPIPELELDL